MTTLYATAAREKGMVFVFSGSYPAWSQTYRYWAIYGVDKGTETLTLTDDAFKLIFGVTDTPPADECWEYFWKGDGWRRVKVHKPPAPAAYYAQQPAAPGEPPTPVVEPTNPFDEMRDDIAFLKRAVAKVSPEYIELSLNGIRKRLERLERIPVATDCLVCEQDLRDAMKHLKELDRIKRVDEEKPDHPSETP